jgi:hypothetical protein
MINQPPQDRMLKSSHTVNRLSTGSSSIRPPGAAVKKQAHRAIATVAEVLGRAPHSALRTPHSK